MTKGDDIHQLVRELFPICRSITDDGVRETLSTHQSATTMRDTMNLLAYCDGTHDLVDVSDIINVPVWELHPIVERLIGMNVLEVVE